MAGALERLCATTSVRHRILARFHLAGTPVPLATASEVALLRVTQSALANTVRHAGATAADVTLRYGGDPGDPGDHVSVDVVDDGAGFDPDRVPDPRPEGAGFGLAAMHARMAALGGSLTVTSAPGRGTALTARLPAVPPAGKESEVAP